MPKFLYQIKVRKSEYDPDEFWATPWQWPPVFTDVIEADNRKQAREMVDAEFGRKFPMRTNDENEPYLLKISEVKPNDTRTLSLTDVRECKDCGSGFRVVDHYNNPNIDYKGNEFCSDECKDRWTIRDRNERMFSDEEDCGRNRPIVIYMIMNMKSGRCYVGQTTQAFTLRWWQHFFHGTDTKFHKAIADSELTDWNFSIVEVVNMDKKPERQSPSEYISEREQHWIKEFNAVDDGYNTATAKALPEAMPLFEGEENAG